LLQLNNLKDLIYTETTQMINLLQLINLKDLNGAETI